MVEIGEHKAILLAGGGGVGRGGAEGGTAIPIPAYGHLKLCEVSRAWERGGEQKVVGTKNQGSHFVMNSAGSGLAKILILVSFMPMVQVPPGHQGILLF